MHTIQNKMFQELGLTEILKHDAHRRIVRYRAIYNYELNYVGGLAHSHLHVRIIH